MDKAEYTKALLENANVDENTVFEWAIWKMVCSTFGKIEIRWGQKEFVIERAKKEVEKWINVT